MALFSKWIEIGLALVAWVGILVGIISFIAPKRSIQLYQWIMKNLNWQVEPIDYGREIRNTRASGLALIFVCVLALMALLYPKWFLLSEVLFDGLVPLQFCF